METRKPTLFAVYSVWGNQWLKLAMFMQNWCEDINILISTDSILCSAERRYGLIITHGLLKGLLQTRGDYQKFIEKKARTHPHLSSYLGEFEEPVPKVRSKFMLDSGGYGLTKLFEKNNVPRKLKMRVPNLGAHWKDDDEQSQNMVLEKQLPLKPDILVTLDKVILPSESYLTKRKKVEFSLRCAKVALAQKREGNTKQIRLFAAVHSYGSDKSGNSEDYYVNAKEYMHSLFEFEDETEVTYDGFSVGSLVPISHESTLHAIAGGVRDSLRSEKRKVEIHGLGASSDRKIAILHKYGFQLFDTNLHMKNARNRLIYHPEKQKYVSVHGVSKNEWNCDCKICRKYPWETITENRPSVREVSTVLISLHNLYTNHLKFLNSLA